jgi:hypothetical protein
MHNLDTRRWMKFLSAPPLLPVHAQLVAVIYCTASTSTIILAGLVPPAVQIEVDFYTTTSNTKASEDTLKVDSKSCYCIHLFTDLGKSRTTQREFCVLLVRANQPLLPLL